MMVWWNFFTVLDVMLLVIYRQLREDLSPKAVFYINNVIWFFGLDLYHLYFTLYLWTQDVPTLKEVPQRIVFYPSKPMRLEPRRPEHCEQCEDQDNLSDDFEDQNLSTMMALPEVFLLVITKVIMPTLDVVTDWLLGIELIIEY